MKTRNDSYFVFAMGVRDRTSPVRQVSRGGLALGEAKQLARVGATEDKRDRAVTTNPRSRTFRVVAQYEARTGENVTGEVYRGQKRRAKRENVHERETFVPGASEPESEPEPSPEPEMPAEAG
jgi:hypothetical protein